MTDPQPLSPLLLTKVQVPRRRPDILRRGRLIEALHQNVHRKLTFITAPAGFGKTTLLVDFASEAPGRVCWYHITAEDQDLGRFVRYLGWAFLQAYPRLKAPLRDLLKGALPTQSAVALAGWFNNLLAEHLDDFTLLILDDYHLVGEHLEIVNFIEAFLDHLPDQVRLIVASRSVYGIPTTRLFLRNELGLLGPKDLRFTAEELRALAQVAYGVELPADYAEDLAQRTDGWVIAMLLAVRLRTEGRLPVIRGEREELYAFLAEEVLRHLPARLVRFLLESSIFEEFSASLCREVLAEPQAEAYLQELENRNLFVTRLDTPQEPVYRYHQLFAEFLQSRLRQEDPQRLRDLHLRAATWYWEHQAPEAAIAHRLAAGDREGAAPWMDAAAREMFITGRLDALRQWVEALARPPDLRARAPQLLLYQAKALSNLNRFAESNALLNLARPAFEGQRARLLLANLLVTQGFNAYMERRYAVALPLAQAAARTLGDEMEGGEVALRRAQAHRVEALAKFYLGQPQEALTQLEQVAQELKRISQEFTALATEGGYNLALVLQDLGVFYFQQGRLSDALRAFVRVREIWQQYQLNPMEFPAVLNNLAFLYHRSGQLEKALETYHEAANWARRHQSRWLAAILAGLGEIYYEEGVWDLSRRWLREALEIGSAHQDAAAQMKALLGLAKVAAATGQFAEAFRLLRQATVLSGKSQQSVWYLWRQGQLYWLLGQNKEALQRWETLFQQDPDAKDLGVEDRIRLFLLSSALWASFGEAKRAQQSIQRVLTELTHLGYLHFLRFEARRLVEFLQGLRQQYAHPVLEDLIALAKLPPKRFGVEVPQEQPWPTLRIHGFGSGEVWRNNERIPKKAWRASGARALFFFIVDQGPVSKEQLILAFWPDFSLAQVNSNLHATLWRVRRALGDKRFVQVAEGRYRLHPKLQVEYDVRTFEQLLRQAGEAPADQRLTFLAQAVQLYQGDFLQDLDFPWVDERRHELQRRYREALDQLIETTMAAEDYREAMRWLELALATDPYNDRWNLYWMRCLVHTGARTLARQYYQDYRRRLRRELGVEPDEALQRFADRL